MPSKVSVLYSRDDVKHITSLSVVVVNNTARQGGRYEWRPNRDSSSPLFLFWLLELN